MAAMAAAATWAVAGGPADACVPPMKAGVVASSSWQDRVVEMQAHRRSAVVSAWLENGIRVHHRHMPEPRGRVEVVVCFGGGELLECANTRGLTLLSACYLDAPGSAELSAAEIERLVDARDVRLEGGVAPDGLVLRIWGATRDIESGLVAGAAVFRDPKADPAGIDRAARQARRSWPARAKNERVVVAMLRELLSGRGGAAKPPAPSASRASPSKMSNCGCGGTANAPRPRSQSSATSTSNTRCEWRPRRSARCRSARVPATRA